jgi:hypothetical protein
MEPIQLQLCAKAYRPLKIVAMNSETDNPMRHQSMDLCSKELPEALFLSLQIVFI